MEIKVNKEQFDYINENLLKKEEAFMLNIQISKKGRFFIIEINEDQANEIRDWAGHELQRIGFDVDDEPTKDGQMLEDLIDLFFIE